MDFKTGNLHFDGSITIKGTILEGFSVFAGGDIEILGLLGVGGAKEIRSANGSIFIKGGIAGMNRTVVKAARNIFTRFADSATISCEGVIHIGYYAMNSKLYSREIVVDSTNGQIFGGTSEAQVRIISPTIGSEMEKPTEVVIRGFERKGLEKEIENLKLKVEELKNEQQKNKAIISQLEAKKDITPFEKREKFMLIDRNFEIKSEIKSNEEKRVALSSYLKIHGDGEIIANKKIYPKTLIRIRGIPMEVHEVFNSCTIYHSDGELKKI